MTAPSILERTDKPNLAYHFTPAGKDGADLPIVMFCGGYRSDMNGTKATYLEEQCKARGQGYVRFDYSGHGESEGAFEDGTIGSWADDACDVLDHVANSPVILVGSSMGGWIALILAKRRAGKVQGVVGLAAAPDFTEDFFGRFTPEQQETLMSTGFVEIPNDYSDQPYHYTKKFYEEAKTHLLLTEHQHIDFPVRLIQGMKDKDVPWETAVKIEKNYKGAEVDILFVEDGDHRLSRPEDLELINREIESLNDTICAEIRKSA